VTYSSASASLTINSFQEQESERLDNPMPIYYQNFEQQLHQPSIVDGTAKTSATDFGRVVLAYARQQAPNSYLYADPLLNATTAVFNAAYSVMASSFLWQPGEGVTVHGLLTVPTLRLIVVDSVANIILSALAVIAVITVFVAIDVINNSSSLYEEPAGLLGSAILLCNSDVNDLASELRDDTRAKQDGRVLEHAKVHSRLWRSSRPAPWHVYRDDLLKRRWTVQDWASPATSKIVEVV